MTIKTIFLDRDGIINIDKNYLYKIDEFEFVDGIFDACVYFQKLNYKIIIITNQSGIARRYYSLDDYESLTKWMLTQFIDRGISILDTFYCPHLPDSNCNCRKPKPGMFFEAKKIHNIDMTKSWMIGDKETDSQAAVLAGISNTILVKSPPKENKKKNRTKFIVESIEEIKLIITH